MPLQPDQQIAHYRIVEKIGEGGMGVVWKALDTTLDRPVAIKVLPEVFTADNERLTRFEREAKLLASLNHPHIASVYGFHRDQGLSCIALEYLAGEDLSDCLSRGALETRQAVRVALQVAEALETAHENGVIHRDLKPANIKFTDATAATGGSVAATAVESVKVLDFGLAKGMDDAGDSASVTQSPTVTAAATRDGVILGTAAYMSPEQARGHAADRRSDIWSFGAVLYEMLAGRRPFSGDTVSDTLAAVLRAEVDFAALPADTPAAVRRLLRRCLEKDPRHRQQAIGDARIVLENVLAGRNEDDELAVSAGTPAKTRSPLLMAAAGLLVGVAATAGVLLSLAPEPVPAPLRKLPLTLPAGENNFAANPRPLISPDGRALAYVHVGNLQLRRLDRWDVQEIGKAQGARPLTWSPDSRFVAFVADGKLWKHSLASGESTIIADVPGTRGSASWGADGRILFVSRSGQLMAVSERGGDPTVILKPDPETEDDFHHVLALPDAAGMVFLTHPLGQPANRIELIRGDRRSILLEIEKARISDIVYSPSGHLLYTRTQSNDGIWALPFSLTGGEVTGEPFMVVPEGRQASLSDDGTLVHITGFDGTFELVWVDRQGQVEGSLGQPQDFIADPRLSPDGGRVAVMGMEEEERDIWIHDVNRETKTRLTFEEDWEGQPVWSPDGSRIYYADDQASSSSLMVRPSDGTGSATTLLESAFFPSLAPDGRFMAVESRNGDEVDIAVVEIIEDGTSPPQPLSDQPEINERMPAVSPDGRLVAYRSDESGKDEIYLRRFPTGEGKWQVSTNGGTVPRWRGDSRELYYAEEARIMAVSVDVEGGAPRLGQPQPLFRWLSGFLTSVARFDAASDGQRFVMVRPFGRTNLFQELRLVQNWYSEFQEDP